MTRKRILALLAIWPGLLASRGATGAPPNAWNQIGRPSAPPWVDAKVERRLWLLDAMAAVQNQIDADAKDDFKTTGGPSLAAGLVLDDGLYYSHGAGYRDLHKHHIADENTVYEVGSLTKVFTGTALLTMIDNPHGRGHPSVPMKLDDDVQGKGYYPALSSVCPPPVGADCKRGHVKHGITLRHLVSHTAGLPNAMSRDGNVNTDETTFTTKEIPNTWTLFKPGQRSAYSGDGTAIVGIILEKQSIEQSYAKYVDKHLLAPLGMRHSGFDSDAVPADRLAMKYDFDQSANTFTAHPVYDGLPSPNATVLVPTAALFTSVYDLSRFMRMFLAGKAPEDEHGHEILKPSTLSLATKAVFAAPVKGSVDARCSAGLSATRDGVISSWSACGSNDAVGVNWFPVAPGPQKVFSSSGPYAQHNGGLPSFETQTALDLDPNHKMGATVLISVDRNLAGSIVGRFFAIALEKDLSATAKGADDSIPSWTNQPLAIGVARLLYISGVKLPTGMLAERTPPSVGKPGAPHPFGQQPPVPESDEVKQFKQAFLDHFTPAYRNEHGLHEGSVGWYVGELRSRIGACSTFRVRDAPTAHKVALRLRCAKGSAGDEKVFDATLTVEGSPPYRISALEHDQATSDDY